MTDLQTPKGRLAWAWAATGAPQREIDRRADKTEGHLQALLANTIKDPRADTWVAYARALRCPPAWLLLGEGAAPSEDALAAIGREYEAEVARTRAAARCLDGLSTSDAPNATEAA